MRKKRITIEEAIRFHGHLGPYLILGLLAGEIAVKRLQAKKYFGLKIKVYGATQKPKSCLIDGLQLSTGATYGKGNMQKLNSSRMQILFHNLKNNKKLKISLNEDLIKKLNNLKGHRDCEKIARKLYQTDPLRFFNLTT